MLKAGGSKHHSELLATFGLDAGKREFWQKGLKVIETMIDELEALERRSLALLEALSRHALGARVIARMRAHRRHRQGSINTSCISIDYR